MGNYIRVKSVRQGAVLSTNGGVCLTFGMGIAGSYVTPAAQTIANPGTVAIPAGKTVIGISINSAVGARTINLGTTLGGTEIWDTEAITSGLSPFKYVGVYFETAGTLYFTGAALTARILLL